MWQERYWNKLCEVRTHTFYYQEYLNDSRRMSGWLKAFLAITSTGSIAGWAVWQEYQFVWGAIIALSQVVNAVKRFLPFEKRISVLGIVYSRLTALAVSVENDWYNVSEGHWSTKEINRKITEIKQNENAIYDELNTVYVPDKKAFLNIAEENPWHTRSRTESSPLVPQVRYGRFFNIPASNFSIRSCLHWK